MKAQTIDGRTIVAPANSGRCRYCGARYAKHSCGCQYCPDCWRGCPRCGATGTIVYPTDNHRTTDERESLINRAKITKTDLRHDAPRDYLAVVVGLDGVEYCRDFAPGTSDDEIMEDFERDQKHWRVI